MWLSSSSVIDIYLNVANPIIFYVIFVTLCAVASKIILRIPFAENNNFFLILIVFIEIFGLKILKKYAPRMQAARMLSGILIFIGSLTLIITSFGSGMLANLLAVTICFFISLPDYSIFTELIFLPFTSSIFYIASLLHFAGMNNVSNIIDIWSDKYMILFIYPAIMLLCCQRKDVKLK